MQSKPVSDKARRHAVRAQVLHLSFLCSRAGVGHCHQVDSPVWFRGKYRFWIGVCLSGDSRRLAGVWKDESVVARGLKVFLTLVAVVVPIACSPQPQTHPLDTAPIPANVRILEEPCSPLGAMMCGAVSILSGETAVERRSACIVYVEPNGKRVEQCGSLPLSQP